MEMVPPVSLNSPVDSPLLGRSRSGSVSLASPRTSLLGRLALHLSTYRIQLVVLIALLTGAYLLPPTAVDVNDPVINYWSWSYLNRQQPPVSAWLVDDRGVEPGDVSNGGWDRDKTGLLVVPKEIHHLRRHPIEVLIKVSPTVSSRKVRREGDKGRAHLSSSIRRAGLPTRYDLHLQEAQFKAKRIRTTRPRTLKQATRRYWKMFHADPPKGFDKWSVLASLETRAMSSHFRPSAFGELD